MLFLSIFIPAVVVLFFVLLLTWPIRYAKRTESNLDNKSIAWKFYYANKYFKPVLRAEKDSKLESYFRKEALSLAKPEIKKDPSSFTAGFLGDLMCRPDMSGERAELWQNFTSFTQDLDLLTANLEFAITTQPKHKIVHFAMADEHLSPFLKIADRKPDYFSTANNHILDAGTEGIAHTLNALDTKNIGHSGAYRTREESGKAFHQILGGKTFSHLSYTFSTNGIRRPDNFSVNYVNLNAIHEADYDPGIIKRDIERERSDGAQHIILHLHMGIEYEVYPQLRLKHRLKDLADCGADIIICNHPHIPQPFEIIECEDGRQCFIAYSLGNLTNWAVLHPLQRLSFALKLSILPGNNGLLFGIPEVQANIHLIKKSKGKSKHLLFPLNVNQNPKAPSLPRWAKNQGSLVKKLELRCRKLYHQDKLHWL